MAAVGGKYAALMGKKKSGSGSAPAQKPKAAKVISLKDTAEKNPPPQSNKKPAVKKAEPVKKPVEAEKERDLTRREIKQERASTDRHVPRSGHADHTKEKKNEQVAEALDAERPEVSEKRREFEEREAERKKRDEEEERKVTYADYQKTLVEKKAELASLQKSHVRKVDTKGLATFTEVKKEDGDSVGFMKMKKVKAEQPAAPAKKNGKAEAPAAKKNKFHKTTDIQLGFFCKPAQPKSNFRPRREFKEAEKTEQKAAEDATPVETQEEAPAAAEATEAAQDA